jgi:hypothetical protein
MIELIAYVVGGGLITAVGVVGWFFAYAHAKHLKHEGIEHGTLITVGIMLYLGAGVVFDVLFNLTWGSIIFREVPKEFLFTARVQRHVSSQYTRQRKIARKWAERLNRVDPGHVKL